MFCLPDPAILPAFAFPLTPDDLKHYGAALGAGCAGWRQVADDCPLGRCLKSKTGWPGLLVYADKVVWASGEMRLPDWAREFVRLTDLEPYDWVTGTEVVVLADRALRMTRLTAQAHAGRLLFY